MRQVRNQLQTASEMEAPKVDRIGTLPRDPSKHYVRVEKENAKSEYSAPIDDLIDQGYEIVSEDRSVTGSQKMILMAIDKDIFEAREKQRVADTVSARYAKDNRFSDGTTQVGETELTTGGAMTINQLSASIQSQENGS